MQCRAKPKLEAEAVQHATHVGRIGPNSIYGLADCLGVGEPSRCCLAEIVDVNRLEALSAA